MAADESAGALPETLEELVDTARQSDEIECADCGDLVARRHAVDRRCPGCRHGDQELVTDGGVSRDDLKECWCCEGLHDSRGTLCPNCSDAGCNRFEDGCESDHKPVLTDGGRDQSDGWDRNTDRWWYDRGYSLGVVETRRDATVPRLVGAWSLFGAAYWDSLVAGAFLTIYTVWSLLEWRDRIAKAEHKRDAHDPGPEFEGMRDE